MAHRFDTHLQSSNDNEKTVTGLPSSKHYCEYLRLVAGDMLPPYDSSSKFLALAAGYGMAETGLAEELGYENSRLILVDRDYPKHIRERLEAAKPDMEVIESGLFTFLSQYGRKDVSVVTLFGIEYLLNRPQMTELAGLLSQILLPRALVMIAPFNENDEQSWFVNSFTELAVYPKVSAIYRYDREIR